MWLFKPYFKLSQPFFQELESVKFLFSFLFLMGPFARHLLTKYLHLILAFIKHWKNLLFLWENIICIFRRKRHFLRVNLKNILYETVFEKIPPPPWDWLDTPDLFLSFSLRPSYICFLCFLWFPNIIVLH